MRSRTERHLLRGTAAAPSASLARPPELTWPDYLVLLLRIGAEIEHALMVQYLYAAYSLGGDVPERRRPMVQQWRQTILTIAREEMGHLLTVQNLLCLLGAPPSFGREEYPWDTPFYPFPFTLAPLTLDGLARFVYAEAPLPGQMPADAERWERQVYESVNKRVRGKSGATPMHHVAEIYTEILALLADSRRVPDGAFRAGTYGRQASWDEWGKSYRPRPGQPSRSDARDAFAIRDAHVYVPRVGTRTEALVALRKIAGQGEAPALKNPAAPEEPSHFTRFAAIYRDWSAFGESFAPARPVPVNPTTMEPAGKRGTGTFIKAPHSRAWAHLFNLRYRMLLTYLSHAYAQGGGLIVHRAFAEMYNIRAIAGILVCLPLTTRANSRRAGPPFEMPYSLDLPAGESDRWRLHGELLAAAGLLCDELLPDAPAEGQSYLAALRELDRQSLAAIAAILDGDHRRPR